jgi:hypothetical protein
VRYKTFLPSRNIIDSMLLITPICSNYGLTALTSTCIFPLLLLKSEAELNGQVIPVLRRETGWDGPRVTELRSSRASWSGAIITEQRRNANRPASHREGCAAPECTRIPHTTRRVEKQRLRPSSTQERECTAGCCPRQPAPLVYTTPDGPSCSALNNEKRTH